MDNEYYIKSFSDAQEKIAELIDQVISTDDKHELNKLMIELIAEAKLHFFEKTNCCSEGSCCSEDCRNGIDIEKRGLQLIEKCLHEKKRTHKIQRIVVSWFRDNFWMTETKCLHCINLGFSALEQEELHDQHMARIRKYGKWRGDNDRSDEPDGERTVL